MLNPRHIEPGVIAMLKPVLAASLTLVAGAVFLTEVLASYVRAV